MSKNTKSWESYKIAVSQMRKNFKVKKWYKKIKLNKKILGK